MERTNITQVDYTERADRGHRDLSIEFLCPDHLKMGEYARQPIIASFVWMARTMNNSRLYGNYWFAARNCNEALMMCLYPVQVFYSISK